MLPTRPYGRLLGLTRCPALLGLSGYAGAFVMSACNTCDGKGRWQEQRVYRNKKGRVTEIVTYWKICNDCNGTGINKDAEAGEAFDIAGESYVQDSD